MEGFRIKYQFVGRITDIHQFYFGSLLEYINDSKHFSENLNKMLTVILSQAESLQVQKIRKSE